MCIYATVAVISGPFRRVLTAVSGQIILKLVKGGTSKQDESGKAWIRASRPDQGVCKDKKIISDWEAANISGMITDMIGVRIWRVGFQGRRLLWGITRWSDDWGTH